MRIVPPEGERVGRLARAILVAVLAFRVLLLPALAWNSRYVMDEYTQADYPLYLPMRFYVGLDPIKTVLYVYVYDVAHRLSRSAIGVLHAARLEGALLAFLVGSATFGISRRLGLSRFHSLFGAGVLFSFTNFMERSFRIRSDTVAVFFAVAAAFVAVGEEGLRRAAAAGFLAGAAFLSTQKAVYAVAAFGVAYAVSGLRALPARRQGTRLGAYVGGIAAALLLYGAWFDLQRPWRVIAMIFVSPLRFPPLWNNPYDVGIRGLFVLQTLERNPVSYALGAAGLVLSLSRFRSASPRLRFASVAASVLALLVFLHEQPWPYVFVMALPLLSVFAAGGLSWLEAWVSARGAWVRLAACALLGLQLPRNLAYLRHDNGLQNEVVEYAEHLLAPADRYFDGIGMVATRYPAEAVSWEALILGGVHSELARGDDRSIRRILDGRPKLWILNYRVLQLRDFLPRLLDASYVRVHPNVLLSGAALRTGAAASFVNRWPGRYRLYEPDGSAAGERWRLDGGEREGDSFVSEGVHDVSVVSAGGPRYLLPSGTTFFAPLPVATPPYDLFQGVYD